MGKGGSMSVREESAMSEDTPVNTGVSWPDEILAGALVRRMQSKLHRWAGDDSSRRFSDLFNLVYDPAFLMHAWERVESNSEAKTAGVDGLTAAGVKTRIGVEVFLGRIGKDSVRAKLTWLVENVRVHDVGKFKG
jgi:RNA-directed DNA polymerase